MSVHCDNPEWVKRAKDILKDTGAEDIAMVRADLRFGREEPRIEVEGAGIAPAQCGIRTVIGIEQDVEFFCDDHGRYSDSELLPLSYPAFTSTLASSDTGWDGRAQQLGTVQQFGFRPDVIARQLSFVQVHQHFQAGER